MEPSWREPVYGQADLGVLHPGSRYTRNTRQKASILFVSPCMKVWSGPLARTAPSVLFGAWGRGRQGLQNLRCGLLNESQRFGQGVLVTGVKLDAGSFAMGNDNVISFCTGDAYLIQAIVPSCSNVTNNGQMNHFTGLYNAICMCQVSDLRNGMTNTGDCEF